MSPQVLGVSDLNAHFSFLIESRNDELTLILLDSQGETLSTRVLTRDGETATRIPIPIHEGGSETGVWIGLGGRLEYHRGASGAPRWIDLGEPICSIFGSRCRNLQGFIGVTFVRGGAYSFVLDNRSIFHPFATDLTEPVANLVGDGRLVAASEEAIQGYEPREERMVQIAELPGPYDRPLAVLPSIHASGFLIFTATGRIEVFEVQ